MTASIEVIQSVKDHMERCKPVDIELAIFNVGVIGFQLCIRPEFTSNFLRDLETTSLDFIGAFHRTIDIPMPSAS
jgi:hypothetical protein